LIAANCWRVRQPGAPVPHRGCQKRPMYMKKDLYTWKETYMHEKRPINMKRDDQYMRRDCVVGEGHLLRIVGAKRDLHTWKETHQRDRQTETYISKENGTCATSWVSKETYLHEKRPIYMKRDLYTWKETYKHEKWEETVWSVRGTCFAPWISKETYIHEKRHTKDKKRPTY